MLASALVAFHWMFLVVGPGRCPSLARPAVGLVSCDPSRSEAALLLSKHPTRIEVRHPAGGAAGNETKVDMDLYNARAQE